MGSPAMPEGRSGITVDWMEQALRAGGAADFPAIEEVAVEDIGAGIGLLGEILRCRLTYRDDGDKAPASVIVKLPSQEPNTLRTSKRLKLYKREYDYYRHVGPHVPIRSPVMFYGDFEEGSNRFVLVLEDLGGMRAVDEIEGASAEQAKLAVREIGRLHGQYWDKVDQPLFEGFHRALAPTQRILVQIVYLSSLETTLRNFGSFFSDEMRRLAEAYGPRVADHMSDMATGPMTLMHGDLRLDNMFFGTDDGDDFAVVDWQVSGIGSGLYDVAYFLASSVTTEVRREIEREVLEEYHEVVCSMGAENFTFEECWSLYRSNVLGRLLVLIISGGGVDLTHERSRRLVETSLARSWAAIEDLDAGEYLPTRRALLSPANIFSSLSGGAYRIMKAL